MPLLIPAVRQILFSENTKKLVDISGERGLLYNAASGTLTNGRSSTATIVNFEGLLKNCKPSEIRYNGARRVENLFSHSERVNFWKESSFGSVSITDNYADSPLGPNSASRLQASGYWYIYRTVSLPIGNLCEMSFFAKSIDNNSYDISFSIDSILPSANITVTSEWKRYCIVATASSRNPVFPTISSSALQNQVDILVTGLQFNDVTGQTNQNPSEYVSSASIHNSGVTGVKYFNYQNGNTVASNIVTEGAGAAISGIGILHEGAATNLVIQSQNHTTWTDIGTPTLAAGNKNYGTLLLDLIGDDSSIMANGKSKIVAFTGNAQKSISVFVRQGTSTKSIIRLRDTTASADRLNVEITWSGSVPVLNFITGSQEKAQSALGDNVYCLFLLTTSVTATNTNQIEIYPATDNILSVLGTGNINIGGWQAIDDVLSTTYIPTTTAAVSRAEDTIRLPLVPNVNAYQDKEINLLKIKMKSASVSGIKQLFAYSYGATDYIFTNSSAISVGDGSSSAGVDISGWASGDILLIAVCRNARDGKMSIHVSKNGGPFMDSLDVAYDGAVSFNSEICLANGNSYPIEYIAIKTYKTNKSFAAMQRWIKSRAVTEI